MLKYAIGATLAAFVLIVAGFLILARYTDRNAEAGPAPEYTITVNGDAVSPSQVDVRARQLVLLTLANEGSSSVVMMLKSDAVEQLPAETKLAPGNTSTGVPVPNIRLSATAGQPASALVRFKSSGRYELTLASPGHSNQTVVIAAN